MVWTWLLHILGTRRFRRALPYVTTVVAAVASTYVGLVQDGLDGPVRPLPLVAASVGGLVVGGALTRLLEVAAYRRLESERIPSAVEPGTVRPAPEIAGPVRKRTVATVVGHLLAGRWVALEGEPGVGKSTILRAVLGDARIIERFDGSKRSEDRRFELNFDDIDASSTTTLDVIRKRLGGESDKETSEEMGRAPCLVALDHVERFLADAARVDDLKQILPWIAESAPTTVALVAAQGFRSDEVPIPEGRRAVVTVPRPDIADAVALFEATAPSALGSPLVEPLVETVDCLPRAVVLVAHTVETLVTADPTGTQPLRRVLADITRQIEAGRLDGFEHAPRSSPRDGGLAEAIRAVLNNHLVTKPLLQTLVELFALPDGIPQDLLEELVDVSQPGAPVRRFVMLAHRLGLVHPASGGVASEGVVALYLVGIKKMVAGESTKGAWCAYAASALASDEKYSREWATRNQRNLSAAIDRPWPGAADVALPLLRWPDLCPDEDAIVNLAATCPADQIIAALDRYGGVAGAPTSMMLSVGLMSEALAIATASEDWEAASGLFEQAGNCYEQHPDRLNRRRRLYTQMFNLATAHDDDESAAVAAWGLNRTASDLDDFDPGFAHSAAARSHHAAEAWQRLGRVPNVRPSLRVRIAVETGELALSYGLHPSDPTPDGTSGQALGPTCMAWLTWALTSAIENGDLDSQAAACKELAFARMIRGWNEPSDTTGEAWIRRADEALRCFEALGDKEGQVDVHVLLSHAVIGGVSVDPGRPGREIIADHLRSADAVPDTDSARALVQEARGHAAMRGLTDMEGSDDLKNVVLHHLSAALRLFPPRAYLNRVAVHLAIAKTASAWGWFEPEYGDPRSAALEHNQAALVLSRRSGSLPQQVIASERLADIAIHRGWHDPAETLDIRGSTLDLLSDALAIASQLDFAPFLCAVHQRIAEAAGIGWVADLDLTADEVELTHYGAALELTASYRKRAHIHLSLAYTYLDRFRVDPRVESYRMIVSHCEKARDHSEQINDVHGVATADMALGAAAAEFEEHDHGRLEGVAKTDGVAHLVQALAAFEGLEDQNCQGKAHAGLARAAIRGDLPAGEDRSPQDVASTHLRSALGCFRISNRPGYVTSALIELGQLALTAGRPAIPPDEAVDHLHEAIDLARRLGRSFQLARAHRVLGQLLISGRTTTGESPTVWSVAIDHLTEARVLFLRAPFPERAELADGTLSESLVFVGQRAHRDDRFDTTRFATSDEASLHWFTQLLEFATESGRTVDEAAASAHLGHLALQHATYDMTIYTGANAAAITHLTRAHNIYTATESDPRNHTLVVEQLLRALHNAGRNAVRQSEFDSARFASGPDAALVWFGQLLDLATQSFRPGFTALASLELGLLARRNSTFDTAIYGDSSAAASAHLSRAQALYSTTASNPHDLALARVCQILCVSGRDGIHQMWSAIRSP